MITETVNHIARGYAAIVAADEADDPNARSVHIGVAAHEVRAAKQDVEHLETLVKAKQAEFARKAGKQLSIPGSGQ